MRYGMHVCPPRTAVSGVVCGRKVKRVRHVLTPYIFKSEGRGSETTHIHMHTRVCSRAPLVFACVRNSRHMMINVQ